ncbi:MAG TPA: hypothetical protein VG916_08080 [Gemmatimonadaceae bacterium]|nr:hypothetical protein [Gemmatimonadaceae bacterium]
MTPRAAVVLRTAGTLVMLFFAWSGLVGGVQQIPQSTTAGQQVQSVFQLAFGASALACVIVAWRPHRLARAFERAWCISCALAAGFATVVWGGQSPLTGVLTAAVSLLVAWLLVWPLRRWGAGQGAFDGRRG